MAAGVPDAMRGKEHSQAEARKNEIVGGEAGEEILPSARHFLPPRPPCLFPSFWILYRERYAKVCMHEGRSNGQESREFVRSAAARIRTRYSFLLDSGTRESRRRHVFPHIIVVVVFHIVVIIAVVVVVVVMSVAGEAALSRDARELPVDR